ncbi:hypothetical protein PT974_04549 [Cladobotryum mycophilum]|uniref:Aminoglycoside phosphotransferase domain-containing protein n=1 Tax=Cladobotryum mycophilum TaxID=491253 RepID=A0ABR0SWG8_9HYPO
MALRTISANSWLFGGKFILERTWVLRGEHPSDYTFKGSFGVYYTFSTASAPPPKTTKFVTDFQIRRINKKGLGGVWQIGNFFLKVGEVSDKSTREYLTIQWLRDRPLTFAIPDLVFHAEEGGVYIMVLAKVAGKPLKSVWRSLAKDERDYYVRQVVGICKEFSCYTSPYCAGIDATETPQDQIALCTDLGILSDTFHFAHGDLHTGNILVRDDKAARETLRRLISNPKEPLPKVPLISIIDWEFASFVPLEWIATSPFLLNKIKFLFPRALRDYLTRLEKQFEIEGMPNVLELWNKKKGIMWVYEKAIEMREREKTVIGS